MRQAVPLQAVAPRMFTVEVSNYSLWKNPYQSRFISPKDAVILWKAHVEAGSYQDL